MPLAVRRFAPLVAVVTLLAAAAPGRAEFVLYSFTSDSSEHGGSLVGSFRVDKADLLDGVLSTDDVKDYSFTFTDPSGGTTLYTLGGVLPDIEVDPLTGVPTGLLGSLLGDQIGDSGVAQAELTSQALSLDKSLWVANTRPTEEADGGFGHWEIGPAVSAAPAPAGAVLGLVGVGCLGLTGWLRRRRPA